MNLHQVSQLQPLDAQGLATVNGTWYRVVRANYARSLLGHAHTYSSPSRFNRGTGTYPMLYLAPDPLTAMLEFRALVRVPGASGFLAIKPRHSFALFNVSVSLRSVVDFGCPKQRGTVSTSVQEMTGDWRDYLIRRKQGIPGVRSNRLSAPTHSLGKALNSKLRCIEGFLAPSAVNPEVCNLVIFPDHVAIDQSARSITTRPCK